jgi:hypothetical protein
MAMLVAILHMGVFATGIGRIIMITVMLMHRLHRIACWMTMTHDHTFAFRDFLALRNDQGESDAGLTAGGDVGKAIPEQTAS